jgi:hypothetical protein
MRRSIPHVCPYCLSEDASGQTARLPSLGFNRIPWLVQSIRTCHTHCVSLTPLPGDAPLHEFSAALASSGDCLEHLRRSGLERPASLYELYLAERLAGRAPEGIWLNNLAFYVAADLCENVGAVLRNSPKVRFDDLSDHDLYEAGQTGYRAISRSPDALIDLASDLFHQNHNPLAGPQHWWGRLYHWMIENSRNRDLDPVRDIFREVAFSSAPFPAGTEVLGLELPKRRLHSVYTASKEYGLHPLTVRKTLEAASLITKDAGPANAVIFSADQAAHLLERRSRSISQKEAEGYLNAGRVQTQLMVNAGFITPLTLAGEGGLRTTMFDRQQLDAFLSQMLQRAVPVELLDGDLTTIPSAAKRSNCSAAEIVAGIIDGSIGTVGRDPQSRGYLSVLVDVAEVRELTRGSYVDTITVSAAGKILRTNWRVINSLTAAGHIKSFLAISPLNRCPARVVRRADLDRFTATYVSLAEMAREAGTSPMVIKQRIETTLAIAPAIGPPEVPATYYRRSDLD